MGSPVQENLGEERLHGLRKKQSVNRLFLNIRRGSAVLSGLLVLGFAWIQIKNLSPIPILESSTPQQILHLLLAAGFASWMTAISFDIPVHQAVYVDDPDAGQMTIEIVGAMLSITIAAGLLFWASYDERFFACSVIVFILADIGLWWVLLCRLRRMTSATRTFYLDQDFFELEKLNVLEADVAGSWRWHRYIVMLALAFFLAAVSFIAPFRNTIAVEIHWLVPNFSLQAASALLPAIIFALLLFVAEIWVWAMRVRTKACISVLDSLRLRYRIALLVHNR